eukprot:TRINITY_DN1852_c0_g2_i1.p1 TRINITY_DN1852_c0_g2~~TRINITY_DN1852_c0_g2_i1.p1  ORF type:complete len:752 (-),score=142.79 TRINITY_DN1852_c0_g2_i1:61-2316(-)
MAVDEQKLVIGIDLGTADSYVAYVNRGAIDVVQNEVSQRRTPSLVGFTDRERLLGDAALSQIKSNAKNSCRNFKHLLGQRADSPATETERFWSTCPLVATDDSCIGYSVNYKGETTTFSATATTAMFLTKLREITESWCKSEVADVVIGVPSHFTDFHRAALLDACSIANLNVLRVMNEHTAIAVEYGFFRSNNFDAEKPTTVAFCSMGHSVFSVAIVQFLKGRLTVLCERSDTVGGRDMDECLIRSFAGQFKKKTGLDILANKKACFKLEEAVTKTKKILSANSEASLSCECLMEDEDFSSNVSRDTFLDMCKPMMKRVSDVLEAAKAGSNLSLSSIDSVEICGGASRVPWVKEMCSKAFGGKELSMTMNADECVARGCALQAAILSPLYKARDFKVEDSIRVPVSLGWQMPSLGANGGAKEMTSLIFPGDSVMNLLKVVTFLRKGPFELKASYADERPGTPKELGTFLIDVPASEVPKKVKVKIALTLHGTFAVQGAHIVEEEKQGGDAGMEDGEAGRKRRKVTRTEVAVKRMGCPGLTAEQLRKCREIELNMINDMKEVIETNARKNDLEAYILTMRSSVAEGGDLAPFMKAEDSAKLQAQLSAAEDWLYDHLDDGKEVFVAKLAELQVLGGPAEARHRDETQRPDLIGKLEESIRAAKALGHGGAQRSIAENAKLQGLETAAGETAKWLAGMKEKQAALSKLEDSVLSASVLEAKIEQLQKMRDSVTAFTGAVPNGNGNHRVSMEVD